MGVGVGAVGAEEINGEEIAEPTLEVPLNTVPLYLPESPVVINGNSFNIQANEESLAEVMDTTSRTITGFSILGVEPRTVPDISIAVRFSDDVPAPFREEDPAEAVY